MTIKRIRAIISIKSILHNQTGFSLLEILVAVTILTIGLMATAKMQITAIRGNYISGKTTGALHLAEQKMEDLLGMAWNDANLKNNNTGNDGNLTDIVNPDHEELQVQVNGQVGGGPFHRIWNVTSTSTPIINTKTICVIVTWGSNDGHRVALTSIKHIN
ncbi:MAG: prepilin-type N-terminal cleavage/methylation domain-containing protein [Deltaproteobacteria bacterium]|nr:prepilin-type N-terminal cleavage/methylation domain-containing protein [Deltaproteobacteria bacterium]